MKHDDLCTFCGLEPENILHLLCNCQAVKHLWEQLKTYCQQKAKKKKAKSKQKHRSEC